MPLPTSLSTLRDRPYRLLWTARGISALGNALIPVTMVFAILRTGGSALNVGEVLTCQAVGQVAMLPVGGVWADRLSRKAVLMATDAVQGVCYGLLALMTFVHQAGVWQFAVTYTIAGMAFAFFTPASRAVLPELVGAEAAPAGECAAQPDRQHRQGARAGPRRGAAGDLGAGHRDPRRCPQLPAELRADLPLRQKLFIGFDA